MNFSENKVRILIFTEVWNVEFLFITFGKKGGGEGVVKGQEKVPIAGTFVKPDFDIILPNVIYSV